MWSLLRDSFNDWQNNNALRLSAALAYYSIFSIAPLLVLSVGVAGLFWGADAVNGHLSDQLKDFVGPQASETIETMVKSTSRPAQSLMATIVGLVVLFFGASGVFGQLKDAFNTIWEVKAKPGLGWRILVRERLLSFGMVLVVGFLLLISFLLTTLMNAFNKLLESYLRDAALGLGWRGAARFFRRRDRSLRNDVQGAARCHQSMAPCVGRSGGHGAPLRGRQVWPRILPGAGEHLFELRRGWFRRPAFALGLLCLLHPALWRRVYEDVRPCERRRVAPDKNCGPGQPGRPLPPEPVPLGPHRESLPDVFGTEPEPDFVDAKGNRVLSYAREHMATGLLGALGCGLAVGLASRALPHAADPQDPRSQMRTGLRMLGAASLLLLTRAGRTAANRVADGISQVPWRSFLPRR